MKETLPIGPALSPRRVLAAPARLVALAAGRPWTVAGLGLGLALAALAWVLTHFAMTTDTDQLLSARLAYRQGEAAFDKLFNPEGDRIVIVVDGRTPELAEAAAAAIDARLTERPDLFHDVLRPDASAFFQQNGLLFEPLADVRADMSQLIAAQPFLGPLAADPSLRGLGQTLSTALKGVSSGDATLGDLGRPIMALADTLDQIRAGRPAYFSWRTLIAGKAPDRRMLRHIVLASPVLNYDQLQPGAGPSAFIRAAARRLGLDPAHGVTVRLTGPAPLQDDEFGTLAEGAGLIAALAVGAIVIMLWMAVRSPRLIAAILITTLAGLLSATALGLLIFQKFNVISVAFIPLFVGLGIDFGIQFTVRFRSELALDLTVEEAILAAGQGMGRSLTLAAAAIASGFLAFTPTNYVGVSQLGVIAGLGMIIALTLNLTLLPALLHLWASPARPALERDISLEPLDRFILGHRRAVIGTALVAAAACAALLPWLRFDFNPLHLKSARVKSVATLLDLMHDPDQSPNTLEITAPSLAAANALAPRLERLPSVAETRTLSSFIPDRQPEKLAAIADAASLLDLTLDPIVTEPPPTDAEVVATLRQTAIDLRAAAAGKAGPVANAARRLAGSLDWLAAAPPAQRAKAADVLMPGLVVVLDQTRAALQAAPVTLQSLPPGDHPRLAGARRPRPPLGHPPGRFQQQRGAGALYRPGDRRGPGRHRHAHRHPGRRQGGLRRLPGGRRALLHRHHPAALRGAAPPP